MSYSVEVDTSDLQRLLSDLEGKFESVGDMLVQFLGDRVVPQLEAQSGSQRNVKTGTYSGTWRAEQEGDKAATVTTEAPYWRFLEDGTSRGIQPKPVVAEVVATIPGELSDFLTGAILET